MFGGDFSQFPGNSSVSPAYHGSGHFDQAGDPAGAGGQYQRRSFTKNIVPVNVGIMMQHRDQGEPLIVNGVSVGMVVIVGQVRGISKSHSSYSYIIEDNTGRIEAIHYIDDDEESTQQPVIKNTFVKIIGNLKYGPEQNMMTVYKVIRIQDMDEVVAHKLELQLMPLRQAHLQAVAAAAAQATFNNLPVFSQMMMSGGRPMGGQYQRRVPGQLSNHGDAQSSSLFRNNDRHQQLSLPRPLPLAQDPSSGSHHNIGFEFAPPTHPEAKTILTVIKSCGSEDGIKLQDIFNNFSRQFSAAKIRDILEYLISEGYIYTTVDEYHFKSTES